jgi:superfamily I DNA and/or RNA helicase
MLFNKYQYSNCNIRKRGYSQTCIVQDTSGNCFWVKWILGIDKSSTKAKILADKLRHLQKARHSALPEIIEYGYDEEQQTFAIVFQNLTDIDTLENCYRNLKTQNFISGLMELADCLTELHKKFQINHGDIHPANILIDRNGQFYLIDFGLSDITKTLSQEKELEIFARDFAAPEKLNRLAAKGFPYQADIYSFGKVIDWYFHQNREIISEEQNKTLQKLLAESPSDRPNWQQVIDILKNFVVSSETESIQVAFRTNVPHDFLETLNKFKPIFDVSPRGGDNYLFNMIVGNYVCESVLWIKLENKLLFNAVKPLASFEDKVIERYKREGKRLPFNYSFTRDYPHNKADITAYFQKWFDLKQKDFSLRENRKAVKEELGFYRELLEKEKEVIANHSLRLQYNGFKASGNEIRFYIKSNEKYSTIGQILKHIEEGNDVNSEGFEYVISANADRKQNKNIVEFAGKPYEYEQLSEEDKQDETEKRYALKIKDCEHLKKDSIPQSGYLFENTAKKEEEKNRQLDAIRKVDKNEVQNPDLIYFLFKPKALPVSSSDYSPLESIWQKDANKQPLIYSDNQNKAIRNSFTKSPLSIIQGPPGTGKTTVITEIVFQILAQKPEAKILITSQTNNAVDQVLENLLKNKISILRLSGITAPKVPSIRKHTMDQKLAGWKQQVRETAEKNFNKIAEKYSGTELENLTELHRDWINTITSLDEKSAINQKLIDSIRVIGATCNHIAAKKYSKYNFEFDYVIMDESGKATTAEALVPIITGKNLIFVGDHRQLRPMLTTTREVESWLRDKFKKEADELESWEDYFNRPSLFEQVITNIDWDFKAQLTECRRSSREQVLLTSECFYEPEGDDAIEPVEREQDKEHNLPLGIDSSILFIDMGSHYKHKTDDRSKSSYNEESAQIIPEILELLSCCDKVKDYSFGVITGYTAQYRKLKKNIDKKRFQGKLDNVYKWNKEEYEEKLTVSVVDRFQGLERDIVIVDLVKSGAGCDLGFLETPNRINVALSRQKRLLIMVGDYHSIINAKTRRCNGQKAALQLYLEKIKPEWVVKAEQIKELFPFKEKGKVQKQINEQSVEKKPISHIDTKVEKVDGIKVVGKIDLDALVNKYKKR